MRLYIIRHAEPAYPEDSLTARGHRQARALAKRFSVPGLDRVYSSPLTRALETAHYTAKRLGLDVEVEPWTRELEDWWIPDPAVGELPAWQVDAAALRALGPGCDGEGWPAAPPFDEPRLRLGFARLRAAGDDFLARQGYVREGLRYRVTGTPGRRVALFCHGGFALTWLADLLAVPLPLVWAGFTLLPAAVTIVLFEAGADGWASPRCLALGESDGAGGG
jgi:probable phosphoglycerate mutase